MDNLKESLEYKGIALTNWHPQTKTVTEYI
jgi:hypothetical protein